MNTTDEQEPKNPNVAPEQEVTGSFSTLKNIVREGEPATRLIALGIVFSLLQVATTLAFPLLSQTLIDSMAAKEDVSVALVSDPLVFQLLFVLVLGAITGGISSYVLSRAGLRFSRKLKSRMVDRLIGRSMSYFNHQDSGELVSRLNNDTKSISNFATTGVAGLVEGSLMLIGTLIVLFTLDAKLTVLIFLVILAAFAAMAPVFIRNSKLTVQLNDMQAAVSASLTRCFTNMHLVKVYTAERQEMQSLDRELCEVEQRSRKIALIESVISPINGLALTGAMLIIFAYGGSRVALGTLTIGTLTAFILCIFNIVAPLIQLSMISSQYQSAKGASAKIAALLDRSLDEEVDPKLAPLQPVTHQAAPSITGVFEFSGVRFGYGDEPFLDLDGLQLNCGEKIAIVGPSGAGKSTVFSLLARLYSPLEGRITLNGRDIRTFDLKSWRKQIGFVPQTTTLMSGSVLENIVYGSHMPLDRERALRAAVMANCEEFLDRMPEGLDAMVGENGSLLSGGQRQRIAIARVFYRDPQILLLDEATANLDAMNEREVLQALELLMKGRTTILISHSQLSIVGVDTQICVKDGTWSEEFSRYRCLSEEYAGHLR